MLRKIYAELAAIRKELQTIQTMLEANRQPLDIAIGDGVRRAIRDVNRRREQ